MKGSIDSHKCGSYRGTLLIRNSAPLGPYSRPMPRVLGGSQGGGRFLMGEVSLYGHKVDFVWEVDF